MNKKKLIILISFVIVIAIVVFISTQSYPVAFVNWRPITLKSFSKDFSVAVHYYQKMLETYDRNQTAVLDSSEIQREIKRAVLEQLIKNSLIRQELEKQIKSGELEKMVDNKVQEVLKGKDVGKEIETLYGLSLDEFKERVLRPQTEREILAGRFFLENKSFDDWLKEPRAKIIILMPGFEWNGEKVVIK
jgi:tetrahydromethanopterin S-methyltransferase subunit G